VKTLLLLIVLIFTSACCSILGIGCATDSTVSGATPETLAAAGKQQKKSTAAIETSARVIKKKAAVVSTQAGDVKEAAALKDFKRINTTATDIDRNAREMGAEADNILTENALLKQNIEVLEEESNAKEEIIAVNRDLKDKHAKLKEKLNSHFRTITYALYGLGALLLAVGIAAAIYFREAKILIVSAAGYIPYSCFGVRHLDREQHSLDHRRCDPRGRFHSFPLLAPAEEGHLLLCQSNGAVEGSHPG